LAAAHAACAEAACRKEDFLAIEVRVVRSAHTAVRNTACSTVKAHANCLRSEDRMRKPVATWRIVLAAFLDFFTAFLVLGYLIALMMGETTEGGFQLSGLSALFLFALVAAYFVVLGRYLGGTLWQRLLGTKRPYIPAPSSSRRRRRSAQRPPRGRGL
jgi:hypothetical protein